MNKKTHKKVSLCFLITIFFSSCSKFIIFEPYETKKDDYDKDNVTYTKDKVFKYEVFVTKGTIFKNVNEVKYVELKVLGGLYPFIKYDKDYNQTVIQYSIYDVNNTIIDGKESTGLIENGTNLWFHPIRFDDFLILNTNAYPYTINDKKIKKWSWNLENNFNGKDLVNINQYKKIKKGNKYFVNAKTKNENGISTSEFIFDENNLLLEMNFINFDKSEVKFVLIK